MKKLNRLCALALVLVLCTGSVLAAQDETPGDKEAQKGPLPPSTNPTQKAIYPSKGQTEEQQMSDQLECYRWATAQTGWDPYEAYDKLVEQGYAAARTAEDAQGGAVRGAARGALAGAAIGAIAGDAGKGAAIGATAGGLGGGMRSRRTRDAAQSQADQATEAFNRQLEKWEGNYAACMTGKEYTVN